MPDVTATRLSPLAYLFLLAYLVVSFVVYDRWERPRRGRRPADLWANPVAWRRYWLTTFFAYWAYMVATALALYVLLMFTLPIPRTGIFTSTFWVGCTSLVVGLTTGVAIVFPLKVRLEWKKARQQAGAHQDDPT